MSIEIQIPLIASSNPANGASQISQNGSRFSVVFTRPIIVPKKAKYCWLTVEQSNIVFNTPNISEALGNNKILVEFDDTVTPTSNLITIPDGLWDLDHLNQNLQQQLSNLGELTDAITLLPDTATQTVIIKYRQFYQVDFDIPNSVREVLGFDARISPVGGFSPTDNFYESGDTTAKFNSLLFYLVHSDLVSGHGLRINGNFLDILQQVPIKDVSAGSLIAYEPQNLQKIPCPNLINQSLRELHFWLTDDQNQFVDTLGEFWSVRLNIHYLEDIENKENLSRKIDDNMKKINEKIDSTMGEIKMFLRELLARK